MKKLIAALLIGILSGVVLASPPVTCQTAKSYCPKLMKIVKKLPTNWLQIMIVNCSAGELYLSGDPYTNSLTLDAGKLEQTMSYKDHAVKNIQVTIKDAANKTIFDGKPLNHSVILVKKDNSSTKQFCPYKGVENNN